MKFSFLPDGKVSQAFFDEYVNYTNAYETVLVEKFTLQLLTMLQNSDSSLVLGIQKFQVYQW